MLRKMFCGRGAVVRLAGRPRRAAASSFGAAGSVGQPEDDGGNGGWKSKIVVNGLKVWKDNLSDIERVGSLFTRTGRIVVVGVAVVGVVKLTYEERIRSEETVKFKQPVPSEKINEGWVWIEVVEKDCAAKDEEEAAEAEK